MSQEQKRWTTQTGAVLRAVLRPDGAWFIQLPDGHVEDWSTLFEMVCADICGSMLVNRPANQNKKADMTLRGAGFTPVRQETVWRLPVADILAKPAVHTDHHIVSVSSLDAGAVAELDNKIRQDIPGTEGWTGTGADLAASLVDSEFDPALYRVAKHVETGSLDGLIRVWNRTPEPRLGCIGVTRPWRRTRLALSLVQDIARTLDARGVTHIVAETDTTNRNSHVMAGRQGGEAVRTTIEWQKVIPC